MRRAPAAPGRRSSQCLGAPPGAGGRGSDAAAAPRAVRSHLPSTSLRAGPGQASCSCVEAPGPRSTVGALAGPYRTGVPITSGVALQWEVLQVVLYVASTALEAGGPRAGAAWRDRNRRTARDLLVQLEPLEPRDARDRLAMTGLGGAQVSTEMAMRLHRQQIGLHAGEMDNDGRRQTLGVVLLHRRDVGGSGSEPAQRLMRRSLPVLGFVSPGAT